MVPSPLRSSLLLLPSHLRVATYQHANCRAFSASTAQRFSLVDIAAAGPSLLINTLHTGLHLPWFVALPTTALIVRGVVVYYLAVRPARRAALIHTSLVPLASARSLVDAAQTPFETALGPKLGPIARYVRARWTSNLELHRLGKKFGAPLFHSRGLVNFGVLIAVTEAIRMKCGSRYGLLTTILSPLQWIAHQISPQQSPTADASLEASTAVSNEGSMQTAIAHDEGVAPIADTSALSPATEEVATQLFNPYFDPSLKFEGFSWCLDLTAPDPTLILPTMLAISMAARIIFRPTQPNRKPSTSTSATMTAQPTSSTESFDNVDSEAQKTLSSPPPQPNSIVIALRTLTFFQRIGLAVTAGFYFIACNFPAAILLYLVPATIVGSVQGRWLAQRNGCRTMPLVVKPCRRPLRYRARKEWID